MYPTLQNGDVIIVSKLSYKLRVINIIKLFKDNKVEYTWYQGFGKPKKNEILVFNYPKNKTMTNNNTKIFGIVIVKRCFGMPGDTVVIKNEEVKKIIFKYKFDTIFENNNLFPNDTNLKWTLDNYGPLWIPAKGSIMILKPTTALQYKKAFLIEGYKASFKNDTVFLNDTFRTNYTFKYNYYFMLGDNFYESRDSRYFGFVPETNIIGKAVLVLFSINPDEPWYKAFRWGRFCKRIK
jgi:signal peptidase I